MITANEMIQKMGKKKFIEIATHAQKGERMIDLERRRKYGKRIRYRMCEHGVWVIDDYNPKGCNKCFKEISTKARDFEPHFNVGLGVWVESKSDMVKTAKSMGLTHIGDSR